MKPKERQDLGSNLGAGESPLFPPQLASETEASEAILQVIHRAPGHFGHQRSRWTLGLLMQTCDWLRVSSEGGLSQLLARLGISYKRGRHHIQSPDWYYEEKVSQLELSLLRAWYAPERYVFLYQDELSYYRQPTLAHNYERKGHVQPLAQRSYRSDTRFRIVATMNVLTGQVIYEQRSKIRVPALSDFYAKIAAAYPEAEEIYMAQDNWPVHFHPDVLARLQPQSFIHPPKVPDNWPATPSPKAVRANLPIRLLPLPTYAPWLNPIEKLWRWLKQDVLHLHALADAWDTLKLAVGAFLDRFADGSPLLLRYVGLLPD
jgi:DDE superfamily endonuclease